jgi:hypothetical protein
MVDDVGELLGTQAVVDRNQYRTDLRNRVKGFELRMRVRRNIGDTIALLDAQPLQRRGPTIAAREEFLVSKTLAAVHHRFAAAVQRTGPSRELERG